MDTDSVEKELNDIVQNIIDVFLEPEKNELIPKAD
jgi:hypothetical protein